jgi:hypothetical protein
MVQLFVRRISAPVIFIDVEPACTIAEIKALIAVRMGWFSASFPTWRVKSLCSCV